MSIDMAHTTPAMEPGARDRFALVASPQHTIRFVVGFLGIAALLAFQAQRAHVAPATEGPPPSHAAQYIGMMAFLWAMLWFTRIGMRRRGVSLREVIGGRWRNAKDVLVTIVTSVVFLALAHVVLELTKRGLTSLGQSPELESQRTTAFLGPHGPLEYVLWVLLSVSAGLCEEVAFRGYLQRQFAALTRNDLLGLVISAVIFGVGHGYQGWRSVIAITVFGLLFGTLAHVTRSLRPGILAHALQDILAGFGVF
jgi:membrane protease YdiL (CAAX protease family)